jgi:hypothetical protein
MQICGMREFSECHRSDALYQGTTLVGPLMPNQDPGFSPCAFSMLVLGPFFTARPNKLRKSSCRAFVHRLKGTAFRPYITALH